MRPDSDLVLAIGDLISQLREDGVDPSVSKWLSDQRSLLISQKTVSNVEATLTVLDRKLADLYDTSVVEEGHADLRVVFAKLVGTLAATRELIKEGKADTLFASEAAQPEAVPSGGAQGGRSSQNAANVQENAAPKAASPAAEMSTMSMISMVTSAAGIVFVLVSVATLAVLPAHDCAPAVISTKTWLGLVGSLFLGALTYIIRTIEIGRMRRAGSSEAAITRLHRIQYIGIVQVALFALVCLVLYIHGCRIVVS